MHYTHLISIIRSLKGKNIAFVSLTEGMDTTTASGELFFHIFGALAGGMSKAAICRTFGVKRSTLIDSLRRDS